MSGAIATEGTKAAIRQADQQQSTTEQFSTDQLLEEFGSRIEIEQPSIPPPTPQRRVFQPSVRFSESPIKPTFATSQSAVAKTTDTINKKPVPPPPIIRRESPIDIDNNNQSTNSNTTSNNSGNSTQPIKAPRPAPKPGSASTLRPKPQGSSLPSSVKSPSNFSSSSSLSSSSSNVATLRMAPLPPPPSRPQQAASLETPKVSQFEPTTPLRSIGSEPNFTFNPTLTNKKPISSQPVSKSDIVKQRSLTVGNKLPMQPPSEPAPAPPINTTSKHTTIKLLPPKDLAPLPPSDPAPLPPLINRSISPSVESNPIDSDQVQLSTSAPSTSIMDQMEMLSPRSKATFKNDIRDLPPPPSRTMRPTLSSQSQSIDKQRGLARSQDLLKHSNSVIDPSIASDNQTTIKPKPMFFATLKPESISSSSHSSSTSSVIEIDSISGLKKRKRISLSVKTAKSELRQKRKRDTLLLKVEPNKAQNEQRRAKIVEEIIFTETTYVNRLKTLIRVCSLLLSLLFDLISILIGFGLV